MNNLPIIQIAFADDHRFVRKGIIEFLHKTGGLNVFIEADHGQELLDKLAAATYQPDICIIDITMPVMNGYETALHIKNKYPLIRCVALTVIDKVSEFSILRMLRNGCRGYLSKAEDPDEIRHALIEIYTKGIYFSKTLLSKFPGMTESNMEGYLKNLLTEQEIMLLTLCCSDLTYAEIGGKMNLSKRTVENNAQHLCEKLDIGSRQGLAMYALCAGIGTFDHTCEYFRKHV